MTTGTSRSPQVSDRPAILGGSPAVDLPQEEANRWPIITAEDERAVLEVLRSGQLSIHEVVTALEEDYKRWLDMPIAVAHNNGTGAIHAALHAFDIGPGDEVIVPSATWWSSVMPILHHGGVPVFAETEEQCIGLDPADVEKRIADRTKAIMVVHLFGMPSKMDELMAVANKHNLKVLEDASHAHGAVYKGRKIGTIGDAAVFSMQANKLLPSAEGGMFLTRDPEMWEKVIRYGHYERLLPMKGSPNRRFAATGFGMKYRMSPLSAAVARTQLKSLPERNARRNENCICLSEKLEKLGFQTFLAPEGVQRVYFEFLIRYDQSQTGLPIGDLARALQAEGALVGAPRYPLLHQQPVFTEGVWAKIARLQGTAKQPLREYDPRDLPRTTMGNASLLKLPSFPNADRPLLDQYARAFEKVMAHADDLPREDK
ncbi:MAG: DegT/DnrJ/EryC1/StrS family aminotransferase [Phycisphaerales bacterium]|nr:MAG: DegT/DnrJ/EryC1/StrS family aminotransferase [Phycisphaerales bacterium]